MNKQDLANNLIPGTLSIYNGLENYPQLSFGDYSYYDGNLVLPKQIKGLTIGKFTSIGGGLNFVTYGHPINNISTFPFYALFKMPNHEKYIKIYDEIIIGNDVYIGDSVTIVAPCNIADGCVIATGSQIVGNTKTEPFGVYGGNPAKFIKYRFNEKDRKFLLKLQWWNFDIKEIYEIVDILQSPNIDELRKRYE